MKKVKVGLLGLGTVGSGVLKILTRNQDKISNIAKRQIEVVKALVRDPKKHEKEANQVKLVTDFDEILNDKDIEIVIEAIGGLHPAEEFIASLLEHGKSVVTANKDLIASHGPRLVEIANRNNVDFMYEASVAGGIPILNALSQSFAGDEIIEIAGIVNGTTNYILTQMVDHHANFQDALKKAQELGFAEADPTNDITGKDAAYKMIILTRFAFGANLTFDDFEYHGIEEVKSFDVRQIAKLGYSLKLLGISRKVNNHIFVEVAPTLVKQSGQLAHVKNEYNAVGVRSMAVGNSFFFGPGAGSLPTANSVVSDLMAEVNDMSMTSEAESFNRYQDHLDPAKPKEVFDSFYLSLKIDAKDDAILTVSKLLVEHQIGFRELNKVEEGKSTYIVLVTDKISHQQLNDFTTAMKKNNISVQAAYKILK